MYKYPSGLYVDVRIEEEYKTKIAFKVLALEEEKINNDRGAFIRVFDGNRWYYSTTTDLDGIQQQIDTLAKMATPNPQIEEDPIVKALEANQGSFLQQSAESTANVPIETKEKLLWNYLKLIDNPAIVHHDSYYVDNRTVKSFYSSKGAALTYDKQICGIRLNLELVCGDNKDQANVSKAADDFRGLIGLEQYFREEIEKSIVFCRDALPVEPGEYTVLLGPEATGVFTHESFGHKSESDFMVGDETMKAEWALGKTIGKELLTIIDDGGIAGSGFTPYDDEGTKAKRTLIIDQGILKGRLHSAATSVDLGEQLTGNSRALNFEFEPIVRMTTTYIHKGDRPLKDIIQEIETGIFVDTIKHGSGMSTFTLAPGRAYKIEKGRITTPVKISVITGNVFKTLAEIDAISSEFEILSFVGGGCGKMEQWPLPVGFGGPYTRVKKLMVQ